MHAIVNTDSHVLFQTHEPVTSASHLVQMALVAQVNLSHVDFVDLVNAWPTPERTISHVNFTDQDLTSAHVVGVQFENCDFTRVILRDWHATHAQFHNCVFAGAILDAGSFEDCVFDQCEFVEAEQVSSKARHALRPHSDELVPFDRVLARAANFVRAKFSACVFSQVNFYAAVFELAALTGCILDRCDLESSVFGCTQFVNSHVYRSNLISATLCECVTDSAVFRSNEYVEWPTAKMLGDAGLRLPQQLKMYVQAEWDHFKRLHTDIKTDYKRQLAIRACVILSVPLLALLAWKYVETNWIISMISAVGAMSTWAMRRYFTLILQSVFGYILNKMNDAEGLWKSGHRKAALKSLVVSPNVKTLLKKD